jgi:hypothetical protein
VARAIQYVPCIFEAVKSNIENKMIKNIFPILFLLPDVSLQNHYIQKLEHFRFNRFKQKQPIVGKAINMNQFSFFFQNATRSELANLPIFLSLQNKSNRIDKNSLSKNKIQSTSRNDQS